MELGDPGPHFDITWFDAEGRSSRQLSIALGRDSSELGVKFGH